MTQSTRIVEDVEESGFAAAREHRKVSSQVAVYLSVIVVSLVVWHVASLFISALFLPGPIRVATAAGGLLASGDLATHVSISYRRIGSGWALGSIVAIPLGILAGRVRVIGAAFEPHLNFFRFVPPIAFLSLSLIWFGIGESSKIALIIYASFFIVFLNTITGAQAVDVEKIRGAQCLGASKLQVLTTVILPATTPYIVTGLRTAMGNSFMTVVAAELVAANEGVGWLIWNSRLFARTDLVFVGIFTLGIMGTVADAIFRLAVKPTALRYGIKF